jgi:AcrR family transcriptional regulator
MTRHANLDLPEQILEAAEQMVDASGYTAMNMRDLAQRIGVSATAIYHYYESRDALLLQLQLKAAERLNASIRTIESDDAWATIRKLGETYLEFAETKPHLYQLLFEAPFETSAPGQAEQSVLYYTYHVARRALERLAADGRYPMDPRYGAMMGWTMLHGFASLLMAGRLQLAEGIDRGELTRRFLDFYSGEGRHGGDA